MASREATVPVANSGTPKQKTKECVSSDGEKLLQRRIDELEKERMERHT